MLENMGIFGVLQAVFLQCYHDCPIHYTGTDRFVADRGGCQSDIVGGCTEEPGTHLGTRLCLGVSLSSLKFCDLSENSEVMAVQTGFR